MTTFGGDVGAGCAEAGGVELLAEEAEEGRDGFDLIQRGVGGDAGDGADDALGDLAADEGVLAQLGGAEHGLAGLRSGEHGECHAVLHEQWEPGLPTL